MFYQLKWYNADKNGSCIVSTRNDLLFIINIMIKSETPFTVYNEGYDVTPHELGFGSSEWWMCSNVVTPSHVLNKAGLSEM